MLIHSGPGTSDKDAASVRANQAVPFGVGLYYFEIEVIRCPSVQACSSWMGACAMHIACSLTLWNGNLILEWIL